MTGLPPLSGRVKAGGDRTVLADCLKRVRYKRLAIDVGANDGTHYTPDLVKKFKAVVAIELDPGSFARLIENCPKAHCIHAAASDVDGQKVGVKPKHNLLARCVEGAGKIPTLTIDSLNLEKVDFLKVDVEGYEIKVLMGAENTIKRWNPVILVEQKRWEKYSPDGPSPAELLASWGYQQIGAWRYDRLMVPG